MPFSQTSRLDINLDQSYFWSLEYTLKEISEAFSPFTSAFAALGILFIFEIAAFNSGYYAAMGTEYLNFFSMSDFVTTALFLMPITVLVVFLTGLAFLLFLTSQRLFSESSYIPFLIAAMTFCGSGIWITSYTEQLGMRIVAFAGGLIYFLSASLFFVWLKRPQQSPSRFLIFPLLSASFVSILFGYYMANMDIEYRKPSTLALVAGNSIEVRIFRASNLGILAESCGKDELIFVPWPQIKSLQRSKGCIGKYDETVPFTLRYLFL